MDSLGLLHKKLVRYWTVDRKEGECSYGWLMAYDDKGILFGSNEEEKGSLEGCEWYPRENIHMISFFAQDAE